ncbi:MAG: VanW family protein [Parcubacteria group bacterium GW2011_GWA2_43_17]|nr:MAG: VanW family protein [Parcubacteria group bacterium GW2011_GWA2_43_17]KKT98038.1 MAG: VanW family protein [Parcubacteria group bacterium GW2011_GWC2_45_15]OGY94957.1 MAG: hypothetical protein A2260_01060 [Candidatus Komeilibacteria bacterium RIFOXYA2_FULL_45_9]HAH04344.1 hypothetical protein [Candidatus Komeilibacteria bacterium]HBR13557.1 hypothetical protein [Candidatus Komeilibacteria bacterium]
MLLKKQTSVKIVLPLLMKWLLSGVTIFLIAATAVIMLALIYDKAHELKFFPGVTINHQTLKKMSHAEAVNFFQNQVDDFTAQGLNYILEGKAINLLTTLPATSDPDVSHNLINFEVQKTVDEAYLYGRKQGYRMNFFNQMWSLIFGHDIPLKFNLQNKEFFNLLEANLKPLTQAKTDARPIIDEQLKITIRHETAGSTFDYEEIYRQTLDRLTKLSDQPIQATLMTDQPAVTGKNISPELLNRLEKVIATSTLTLTYHNQSWPVANQIFKDWLVFKKSPAQVELGFDSSTTAAYLTNEVAQDIYRPTLDAKFEIINGRVVEFQGSQDGLDLDIDKSISQLEQDFLQNQQTAVNLVVNQTKSKITTDSVNDLGITQIIGTGYSDFSGSPVNRRHNISVGAQTLNGVLIKPEEEFSLITALGDINAAAGYKPELVIKGDKTIPEYGGGLCQIGTTVFRSALAGGLPITLRRNHSYRVSYYEPAGKDATIYDPWPDLKFINDTGAHILIQSRIEGDDLYFDFWGTSDGRIIEQSDSVIYNIKSPGPTQYIETPDLAPGEKKCTESAHAGADAYFDYQVTYPDGRIGNERFTSHYIPWPARCLIGAKPEAATSTEAVIE